MEYAIGVALLAAVLLGAMDLLAGRSSAELAERGSVAGAPDLAATGATTSTTASPPTTMVTEDPPPPPPDTRTVTVATLSGCWAASGSWWSARFDMLLLDASGEPVPAVEVLVELRIETRSEASRTEQIVGSSTADGTVVMTKQPLKDSGPPADRDALVELVVLGFQADPVLDLVLPAAGQTHRIALAQGPSC